ncbi:MAG: cupin domain-containing protein [Dichotomicrobium sp.]
MAKIADSRDIEARRGSIYPHPFGAQLEGRLKRKLGDIVGIEQFGVNLVTLEPGAWSSQRHWHEKEDEFVYVIAGEATLVTDDGERTLTPGMFAGFPAGDSNAHQLANNSDAPVIYLEIGTRIPDERAAYPDVDMKAHKVDGNWVFTRNDGTPY